MIFPFRAELSNYSVASVPVKVKILNTLSTHGLDGSCLGVPHITEPSLPLPLRVGMGDAVSLQRLLERPYKRTRERVPVLPAVAFHQNFPWYLEW